MFQAPCCPVLSAGLYIEERVQGSAWPMIQYGKKSWRGPHCMLLKDMPFQIMTSDKPVGQLHELYLVVVGCRVSKNRLFCIYHFENDLN